MTWSDLVCAYIAIAVLWGDRMLEWREKWDAIDKAASR